MAFSSRVAGRSGPSLKGRKGKPDAPRSAVRQSSPVVAHAPVSQRTERSKPKGIWRDPKDATQHVRDFQDLADPNLSSW